MFVTQKCQYALRAIFALAKKEPNRPIKIAQIAAEQAIPFRFLEVILSQLKQGGFVESRRGTEGGYLLALKPNAINVGDIVRFIDGPNYAEDGADSEGLARDDVFSLIWRKARKAVFDVFDSVTIEDLINQDEAKRSKFIPNYII